MDAERDRGIRSSGEKSRSMEGEYSMILSKHVFGISMGAFIVTAYGIYMFTYGGDGIAFTTVIGALVGIGSGIGGYLKGIKKVIGE